jgi:hypothetical protein
LGIKYLPSLHPDNSPRVAIGVIGSSTVTGTPLKHARYQIAVGRRNTEASQVMQAKRLQRTAKSDLAHGRDYRLKQPYSDPSREKVTVSTQSQLKSSWEEGRHLGSDWKHLAARGSEIPRPSRKVKRSPNR